jgi:glucose/arabinose dehydrogenase
MALPKTAAPLAALVLTAFASPIAAQSTSNPINALVPVAPWSLVLEDVVTVPNNNGSIPRLEFLTAGGAPGMAYVIEQRGDIWQFDPSLANPTPTKFLDLDQFLGSDYNFEPEGGLRGLAFHPDFNNAGTDGFRKFYTSHSRNEFTPLQGTPVPKVFPSPITPKHDSVVAEWTVNANGTVNTSTYRELMRIGQPYDNHNIGQIGFNPTAGLGDADYGKLYIAVADGGSSNDPHNMAQDIDVTPDPRPFGKVLRIDPIVSGSSPYTIPGDNPFAGQANRVQETWAYGLRNPHKFAWDDVTGLMYIADIGQGNIEEINIVRSGANYGWDLREGTFVFSSGSSVSPLPGGHPTDAYAYPVAQYDHDPDNNGTRSSSAVTSGPVYRGSAVPELTGMYLFAEFATNSGPIYAVDVDDLIERDDLSNVSSLRNGFLAPFVDVRINDNGTLKTFLQFLQDESGNNNLNRTDTRFGVDANGEVYIMNKHDGVIRRIAGVVGLDQGDADRDGDVDGQDLAAWEDEFGAAGDWSDGNFDADGDVDGADFLTWQRNVGATPIVANDGAVPEPSTGAMLALLGASWGAINARWQRRQKRREAGHGPA